MTQRRTAGIVALAVVVLVRSLTVAGAGAQVPSDEWQALLVTAAGSRIRITLPDGQVEGQLVSADPETCFLNANRLISGRVVSPQGVSLRDTHAFDRATVVALEIRDPWPSFRAPGAADPGAVRRVLEALGVGRSIDLTIGDLPRQRVEIRAISDEGVTVRGFRLDRGRTTSVVSYARITSVRPAGVHGALKTLLVAGAAGLGVMFLIGLAWGDE